MPKLSVVVPVYNVEKYINQCIDSILGQSLIDIEIILVDDGSTDKSGEICDEYAEKDSRVIVIHKENEGVSVARNIGIKTARSEYICFVDSDDYIDTDMFRNLYQYVISNDLDVVKCGYSEFHNDNIISVKKYKNRQIYCGETAIKFSMKGSLFTVVWNAIYKKEIVEKVMFPEGIINEDVYFSAMVLYYTKKIGFINSPLYYYRDNPAGITKSEVKTTKPLDVLIALSMLHEQLSEKNLKDREYLAYLRRRMAGKFYGFLKNSSFTVRTNRAFYDLMCENLNLGRRLKMFFFRLKGRIKFIK